MGLFLLLLWAFCLVYGLCSLAFLIAVAWRWAWSLLPDDPKKVRRHDNHLLPSAASRLSATATNHQTGYHEASQRRGLSVEAVDLQPISVASIETEVSQPIRYSQYDREGWQGGQKLCWKSSLP
jgi:hypothetical protein